jgi:hypothetical protein
MTAQGIAAEESIEMHGGNHEHSIRTAGWIDVVDQ